MKIKFTQLDKKTREFIANAIQYYFADLYPQLAEEPRRHNDISRRIRHGELLLGEYQYNELEEGGQDEAGH